MYMFGFRPFSFFGTASSRTPVHLLSFLDSLLNMGWKTMGVWKRTCCPVTETYGVSFSSRESLHPALRGPANECPTAAISLFVYTCNVPWP